MTEIKLRNIYKCNICGNVIEILYEGKPALVCCGEPMVELSPKTEDKGNEKHVPIIEEKGGGVLVKIGAIPHPMEEKHYIQFVEVLTKKKIYRHEFKHGEKPEAEFNVKKSEIVEVREYCNLHGLWKA